MTCPNDHTFQKVFEVEKLTGEETTEVHAYCPHCDKDDVRVTIPVEGRIVPDAELLRGFGLNPEEYE